MVALEGRREMRVRVTPNRRRAGHARQAARGSLPRGAHMKRIPRGTGHNIGRGLVRAAPVQQHASTPLSTEAEAPHC